MHRRTFRVITNRFDEVERFLLDRVLQ